MLICALNHIAVSHQMARRESRSRSREREASRNVLLSMRRGLSFHHDTAQVHMGQFLKLWMSHLLYRPVPFEGRTYFRLFKEVATWTGDVWMRLEAPYIVRSRGLEYAVEFTLWHGNILDTATQLALLRGQANRGQALIFNWPGAGNRGKIVVSRLIGMSLLFDATFWGSQGYVRNDERLIVHHRDGRHQNCFVNNLVVDKNRDHRHFHARSQR